MLSLLHKAYFNFYGSTNLDEVQDVEAKAVYDLSCRDNRILEAGCRTVGILYLRTPSYKIGMEAAIIASKNYPVVVLL